MAGIQPPVLVTDIDPKLAVHRSNNQNRDATPGQKAMAVALAFPETQQGKKRTSEFSSEVSDRYINQARFVLRNNPKLAVHRSNNQNRDATPGQKAMATAMAFPETQQGKKDTSQKTCEVSRESIRQARFVLRNNPPAAGQKAMATAMAFPEDFKRGRKKNGEIVDSINNFDRSTLSRARFVLRNNPKLAVHRSNNQNRDATPGQKARSGRHPQAHKRRTSSGLAGVGKRFVDRMEWNNLSVG